MIFFLIFIILQLIIKYQNLVHIQSKLGENLIRAYNTLIKLYNLERYIFKINKSHHF